MRLQKLLHLQSARLLRRGRALPGALKHFDPFLRSFDAPKSLGAAAAHVMFTASTAPGPRHHRSLPCEPHELVQQGKVTVVPPWHGVECSPRIPEAWPAILQNLSKSCKVLQLSRSTVKLKVMRFFTHSGGKSWMKSLTPPLLHSSFHCMEPLECAQLPPSIGSSRTSPLEKVSRDPLPRKEGFRHHSKTSLKPCQKKNVKRSPAQPHGRVSDWPHPEPQFLSQVWVRSVHGKRHEPKNYFKTTINKKTI